MRFNDSVQVTNRRITDEGYLVVDAVLARTGVQQYLGYELGLDEFEPETVVNVYRPPEQVFEPLSMASFEGKPVTNDHPPVFVDINNIKTYQVGHVSSAIVREGDYLKATLVITDPKAISLVTDGKVEISNGYSADYVLQKGVTNLGEAYEIQQQNIRGNHIAIVSKGRCGGDCKILDAAMSKTNDCQCQTGGKMKDFIINKKKIRVADEDAPQMEVVQETLEELQAMLKEKEDAIAELRGKIEALTTTTTEAENTTEELKEANQELQKTVDRLNARVDELKANRLNDAKLTELVNERIKLRDTASRLIPSLDCSKLSAKEIKIAVIKAKHDGLNLDGKSDEYINARFDAITDSLPSDIDSLGNHFKDAIVGGEVNDARAQMIERNKSLWKRKAS